MESTVLGKRERRDEAVLEKILPSWANSANGVCPIETNHGENHRYRSMNFKSSIDYLPRRPDHGSNK